MSKSAIEYELTLIREREKQREKVAEKQREERKGYGPDVYFCPRCNRPCSSIGCSC